MFWDILAYASVFIAALMLAVDTSIRRLRDAYEGLPTFMRSSFWGYTPLALMVLGGVIWVVRASEYKLFKPLTELPEERTTAQPTPILRTAPARTSPEASVTSTSITTPIPDTPTPEPTATQAAAEPSVTQTEAPLATSTSAPAIDPLIKNLTGILHGRNRRKAEAAVREYLGRRITVSGTVQDVYPDTIVFQKPTWDDPTTYMYFDQSPRSTLPGLKEGEQITVEGEVERIESNVLVLRHCRIQNPAGKD